MDFKSGEDGSDCYRLFGLTVKSELVLPVPKTSRQPQVCVSLRPVSAGGTLLSKNDDPAAFVCFQQGQAVTLCWPGMRFHVLPGRVLVDAEDLTRAAHFLAPSVWSVVLAARGRESLHGSAVEHAGRAVALLGASGTGKSTASVALIERGWRLVSDDLLTFAAGLRVVPGLPWARLVVDGSGERIGPPDAGGKLRVHPPLTPQPVPLVALVVLSEQHDQLTRLWGTAAAVALLRHPYMGILTHPGQERRRFDLVRDLAAGVPVYGAPPRSLSADELWHVAGAQRA